MHQAGSAIVFGAGALLLALSTGCAESAPAGSGGAGASVPGTYSGTYEVPVTADLASAAVFSVPEIEWTVSAGTVELRYALPRGLVGKSVRVAFNGPVDAAAGTASLTGPAGTGTCTITSAAVVCHEHMTGLMPLVPDYAEIEKVAQSEFAGPASQRVDVAKVFASDPIGIVHVDLDAPVSPTTETEKPADF